MQQQELGTVIDATVSTVEPLVEPSNDVETTRLVAVHKTCAAGGWEANRTARTMDEMILSTHRLGGGTAADGPAGFQRRMRQSLSPLSDRCDGPWYYLFRHLCMRRLPRLDCYGKSRDSALLLRSYKKSSRRFFEPMVRRNHRTLMMAVAAVAWRRAHQHRRGWWRMQPWRGWCNSQILCHHPRILHGRLTLAAVSHSMAAGRRSRADRRSWSVHGFVPRYCASL